MKYRARAAALLLLPMAGAAWAQSGAPAGGIAPVSRIAQGAACAPGNPAPGCRPAVAAALPPTPIRTGDHPGFGRVVFDLPAGARWSLDRAGDRLTVRFSGADPVAGAPPPRNVRALTAASGTAELWLMPGVQVRSTRLDNRLVLDVLDPAAAPASEPPVRGVAFGVGPAAAAPVSGLLKAPSPGGQPAAAPPNQAQARAQQQAAMGDLFGGRTIPPNILKILADPRIEPVIAYIVWQAARRPIDDWTVRQLQEITTTIPTLTETGIPMAQIQALYQYLGLDPGDVFNPQLGQDWQGRSIQFDRSSDAAVAAISSADCQADPGQMTVAIYRSCVSGGQ